MSADEAILAATRRWWFGPAGKHSDAVKEQLAAEAMQRACADRVAREAQAERAALWDAMTPAERAARIEANVLIARVSARA